MLLSRVSAGVAWRSHTSARPDQMPAALRAAFPEYTDGEGTPARGSLSPAHQQVRLPATSNFSRPDT
ncbi:MAG TPA: hypothetical protein VGF67_15435 [Ktedonobacteraceae bacterium]